MRVKNGRYSAGYAMRIKKIRYLFKIITDWKFLNVEYHDLVRVIEEGLHLINDVLHWNGLEHTVIGPPHRIGVGIMSDSYVQISNPVDELC